ncbi:hypothetical protein [Microvirga pudoricolor]|uniref:hypothetical protein n=1 Tax=Microvirga pudoricolor TaxID=2778729 RepID=UPI001951B589|nr:hypothetical protein [Microvirga pudoricolor]MBM6595359.1 hypothetical protein [Microvirga pudoricolor]
MDALFYPTLSLPGSAWTNPNLLYFDQIGVIAPHGDERELFDFPTRILMEHGLVRPIHPEPYATNEEDDAIVLGHLLGMAQTQRAGGPVTRIHLGKIAYTRFPSELREFGLLWPTYGDGWLEGPTWVCDYVMSVLATRMMSHPHLNVSLLTNQPFANRLVVGLPQKRPSAMTRRMQALARLLPVGPDAEIHDIMRFRDDHRRELKHFRQFVEQLIVRSKEGPEGQGDFEARLREAERLKAHLVDELRAMRSRIPPAAIVLSVAPIAASLIENAYYSAATAVAGLGYLLYTRAGESRREREVMSDKIVYAALASRDIAARRAEDVLR